MYTGRLAISDSVIGCAVLEDERRLLVPEGIVHDVSPDTNIDGIKPLMSPQILEQENLQPFIVKRFKDRPQPIQFKSANHGGAVMVGYPAEVVPELCIAVLEARDAGALTSQQLPIAERCDALVRGLAAVGIIALVDEATGYQAFRRRDALNRILEAYISKELMSWTKRFPDEFYQHMFRLWGWEYNLEAMSKRPGFAGSLTKKLVYEKLPPGVLDELQRRNPTDGHGRRKWKLHQLLTADIGHPHLQKHVTEVTVLMRISNSKTGFMAQFARAFPTKGTQTYLDVDSDELDTAD